MSTGHSEGIITINIAEADDPFREKMRVQMGEAYRTVLGHFRHEIGHYYWGRLVRTTSRLSDFRATFGDETLLSPCAFERGHRQAAIRSRDGEARIDRLGTVWMGHMIFADSDNRTGGRRRRLQRA